MKKTYEARSWDECRMIVGKAHAIGVLGDALLTPVEGDGPVEPDWDLTILFAGFDREAIPEPVVERRVTFEPVVEGPDPEVFEAWVDTAQARGEAREELALAADANRVGQGLLSDAYDLADVPPVAEEPATTRPELPAEPDAAADETKPCRGCGEPKPLSRFGKDSRTPDGKAHTCLDCKTDGARRAARTREQKQREIKRKKHEAEVVRAHQPAAEEPPKHTTPANKSVQKPTITRLPRGERPADPEKIAVQPRGKEKAERFCANGQECMSVEHTGQPTRLTHGNTNRICFGCEERDRARLTADERQRARGA